MSTQSKTASTYDFSGDSEDELDWEEVSVPQAQHLELDDDQAPGQGPSTRPNIEVTLEAYPAHGKDGTKYAVFLVLTDEAVEAAIGKSFRVVSLTLNACSASTVTRCIH
jgi:hypothetical protein